jgi:hypothetical protein
VESSFRPEFLNRIDQVFVFHPLRRDQMRALLDKELADVLQRRGFRSSPWAVIFDESAIDFLIWSSPTRGVAPVAGAADALAGFLRFGGRGCPRGGAIACSRSAALSGCCPTG